VAAVLLAALSGAVWWAKKHPESTASPSTTPAAPKLTDVPDNQVKEIDLTKKNAPTVVLKRESGKWTIASPDPLAADQDAVTSLVSSLSPVTGDSVVEDKASDLSKYGLSTPSLTLNVVKNDGKSEKIVFGDDLPAGSLVYAQHNSDPKVYAVSSSVRGSFDKSLNDLRDKRLLTFDSNKLTSIEIGSAKMNVAFGKNNQNDWQIVKPKPYRADNFQVEELLRKLTDAKMDLSGNVDDTKKVESSFAGGQPVAVAKASDAAGTQTLEVRKNKDDYYAKSNVVKGAYKVPSDLGKELEKPLDDFRSKKLFDFGFSDPNKIELQQNGAGKSYQKSGQDWKLNGKTIDPASIQAFIDKLRDAAATKFVETGFTTPMLDVTVTSNDGKRVEKVSFSKSGFGYIARRENEPTLYQLDAKVVDDILKASSDIKESAKSTKK
jgi:hypothetical protein